MVGMGQTWDHMAHFQEAAATQVDTNADLQKCWPSAAEYWFFQEMLEI